MLPRIKNLLFPVIFLPCLFLSVTFLQSCDQDFVTPGSSNLPDDVVAVFNTQMNSSGVTCVSSGCHSQQSPQGELNLTDWNSIMRGSVNGTMVIAYNGFWSHLTATINSDTNIAPSADLGLLNDLHKLDSGKVATIINWINNGAKNKEGNVYYTNPSPKTLITNQAADLVAVVYPNPSNKFLVTRLIPVGSNAFLDAPHYVNIDPQKRYFFVSLITGGTLERHEMNADYPWAGTLTINAGSSPAHIEISPDGQSGYVTNFDASGTERRTKKFSVSPFEITDTAFSPNMNAPHGMALSSNGQYLYVSAQIGEYLFKITTADMEIEMERGVDVSVPPGGNGTGQFRPYQIVLSPDGNYLFVSFNGPVGNSNNDKVRVFNSSDLSFVTDIEVGNNPILMKITPDGRYLFVCNKNKNSSGKYTVSIVDVASRTLLRTVEDVGVQPHGVDFTPDGQYAIIACETQAGFDGHHPVAGSKVPGVSRVIRVSDFSLLSDRLEMGSYPAGIVTVP
jgi:DNA-binding beta-propeller fold protein YncE